MFTATSTIPSQKSLDQADVDARLNDALREMADLPENSPLRENLRNEVIALATGRLRRILEEELREDESFARLLDQVVERRLDPASAASKLLDKTAAEL